MRRPRRNRAGDGQGDGEHGMSALEVVLLAPLVIGFIMVLVCFGILVNARGNVQGAARDAARMGSLQRNGTSASTAASDTAATELRGTCSTTTTTVLSKGFTAGGLFTIEVACTVSLSGLDWFSLGNQTVTAYSTAPLDTYRRTGTG